MKNWKMFVEKKNAKTYVIPSGWDSRDEIANQLECSPDKVDDHLRPALKSGEVIKQSFKVWDSGLARFHYVTAYQEANKAKPVALSLLPSGADISTMKRLKADGKTYAEIGRVVGMSGDQVRGKLRRSA